MKFKLTGLSEIQRYRWMVLARCLLAIFAGFIIANLTIPIVGLAFPNVQAFATLTGFLLSFVIWLIYILYVFSAKQLMKIVYLTVSILFAQGLILLVLKLWGAP